jgi:hypothetical protein
VPRRASRSEAASVRATRVAIDVWCVIQDVRGKTKPVIGLGVFAADIRYGTVDATGWLRGRLRASASDRIPRSRPSDSAVAAWGQLATFKLTRPLRAWAAKSGPRLGRGSRAGSARTFTATPAVPRPPALVPSAAQTRKRRGCVGPPLGHPPTVLL